MTGPPPPASSRDEAAAEAALDAARGTTAAATLTALLADLDLLRSAGVTDDDIASLRHRLVED